jgi:hypothetical protein
LKKLVNWLYFVFAQLVLVVAIVQPALAYRLIVNNYYQNILPKKVAIYRVLARHNSPLVKEVDSFINACISYEVNCYLLPAIAGVESGFGRHLLPESHNPFGWGGGYLYFASWQEGFFTVAKGIRENYLDYGLTSVGLIGPVYAPPSTTWASKVLMFMEMFEKEEAKIPTGLLEI